MFRDVRRIAAAGNGGAGLDVVGGFSRVHFDHAKARNCILPAGQGTSGSQGIGGLRARAISGSKVLHCIQEHCETDAIVSEDLDYNWDQDAISFLVGTDPALDTVFQSYGGVFKNSGGRGIKVQCTWATVDGAHFIRTAGLNAPKDPEIDLQLTGGTVKGCTAYYDGGAPNRFVMVSGVASSFPPAEGRVLDNTIRMGAGTTTIGDFMTAWANEALLGDVHVAGNRVYGTVRNFVDYRVNGPLNTLYYERNWAQEYSADSDGHRAAIKLIATGATSPYAARVVTKDIHYDGSESVHVLKDNIAGVVALAEHSAIGPHRGFVNAENAAVAITGLRNVLSNTLQVLGSNDPRGFGRIRTVNLFNETEVTVPINLQNGPILLIKMTGSSRTYRVILSIDNSSHDSTFTGSNTQVGAGADPGSGAFRIWRSASNQLTFWQNTGSTRRVVISELNIS
jgi:hypothetical protein